MSASYEPIRQTVRLAGTPQAIYAALLDTASHAGFTESGAEIIDQPGGRFSAYDGYIEGVNVELLPGRRIVQAWRAADWPEGVWSLVTFDFSELADGTQLVFEHLGVPAAQREAIAQGWHDFYWTPLGRWLGERA